MMMVGKISLQKHEFKSTMQLSEGRVISDFTVCRSTVCTLISDKHVSEPDVHEAQVRRAVSPQRHLCRERHASDMD